jgi:cellulose biosynthesis protein BcsQ
MKTIVIANQKGGSSKSTLTVHLATAAEESGDGPALIHDADPQSTAGDWFNRRMAAGLTTSFQVLPTSTPFQYKAPQIELSRCCPSRR